jgi:hypothetical protein
MQPTKAIITTLFVTMLTSVLNAQPLPPGGFPPPPGGGPTDCVDPADCTDLEEPVDEEESDDPMKGLVAAVESLEEFTRENCNSQRDMIKFQALLKELKDVVGKLRKLPGLEGNEDVSAVNEGLRSLKSEMKDLCVEEDDDSDGEE